MIIQIIGIAGSGKSYICSKLKNVTCLDTDDYFCRAYNILKDKSTDKKIATLADKLFKQDIKNAKHVVITGITLQSKKTDRIYFIKMNNSELESAYRRVVKRELLKYTQLTDHKLINNIDTMDPNKIQLYLYYTYFMGIDPLIMTFIKYKEKYNKLLKKQTEGVIIKSQSDIINEILILQKIENNNNSIISPYKDQMEFNIETMSDEIQNKINDDFYKYQIETTGLLEYKTIAFTARQNCKLIGVVTTTIKWGQLHIKTVIVDSEYRKQGIGSKLLLKVLDYGKEHGCTLAFVETSSFQAPEFYKKLGFVVEFIRSGYSNDYSYYYLKYKIE